MSIKYNKEKCLKWKNRKWMSVSGSCLLWFPAVSHQPKGLMLTRCAIMTPVASMCSYFLIVCAHLCSVLTITWFLQAAGVFNFQQNGFMALVWFVVRNTEMRGNCRNQNKEEHSFASLPLFEPLCLSLSHIQTSYIQTQSHISTQTLIPG